MEEKYRYKRWKEIRGIMAGEEWREKGTKAERKEMSKKYGRGRTPRTEKWIKRNIKEKWIKEGKLTNELIIR